MQRHLIMLGILASLAVASMSRCSSASFSPRYQGVAEQSAGGDISDNPAPASDGSSSTPGGTQPIPNILEPDTAGQPLDSPPSDLGSTPGGPGVPGGGASSIRMSGPVICGQPVEPPCEKAPSFVLNSQGRSTITQVRGFVWDDVNANGVYDVGEPPMPNIYVYIDYDLSCSAAMIEHGSKTDENGYFRIYDPQPRKGLLSPPYLLREGTYALRIVRPFERDFSYPPQGAFQIKVTRGDIFAEANFGLTGVPRASGAGCVPATSLTP